MSFPIAYRTQILGVPKSLKDPHITRVLGTPGPQIGGSPFHADTGLCGRKQLESRFHHYRVPVKLVQACMYVRETPYNVDLSAEEL